MGIIAPRDPANINPTIAETPTLKATPMTAGVPRECTNHNPLVPSVAHPPQAQRPSQTQHSRPPRHLQETPIEACHADIDPNAIRSCLGDMHPNGAHGSPVQEAGPGGANLGAECGRHTQLAEGSKTAHRAAPGARGEAAQGKGHSSVSEWEVGPHTGDAEGLEISERNSSGYTGVTRHIGMTHRDASWEAYYHSSGIKRHIGHFYSAVEAARARKAHLERQASFRAGQAPHRARHCAAQPLPASASSGARAAPAGRRRRCGKRRHKPEMFEAARRLRRPQGCADSGIERDALSRDSDGDLVFTTGKLRNTPRAVAALLGVSLEELVDVNRAWYLPDLAACSRLEPGSPLLVPGTDSHGGGEPAHEPEGTGRASLAWRVEGPYVGRRLSILRL